MPNLATRMMRTTWGFPLVVAVALLGMVGNELAYHRTQAGIRESSRADEVAQQANRAHYNALDRVNALRAYLLTPNERWIDRFRETSAQLEAAVTFITLFLEQTGPDGQRHGELLNKAYRVRSADLDAGFQLALQGKPTESLAVLAQSDAAQHGTALRDALAESIRHAQRQQKASDGRLVSALAVLRWLVHALIAAMLVSAYTLFRQALHIDTTRRNQASVLRQQVAARTAELRDLAGYLMTTREDERSRLARELHDEMGALLSTIKLDLARARRNPALPAGALAQLESVDRRVTEVVGLKRRVIENLRPSSLDHLGLKDAVSILCQEHAAAMQVPTHEDLDPLVLAPDQELTLYRLIQEALTNARNYSQARQVWVALKDEGDHVGLRVDDDGIGFDEAAVASGHHGLAGMRLRVESQGGEIEIGRRPEGGTRIAVRLPVRKREAGAAPPLDAAP